MNDACNRYPVRLSLHREWLGPGGSPGLQNLWRVALRAAVGSTPIHSRLFLYNKTLKVSGVTLGLHGKGGSVKYALTHAI